MVRKGLEASVGVERVHIGLKKQRMNKYNDGFHTCLRLKKPFLSQLGMYSERARTREVSFMLWMRLSNLLLQGPYTHTDTGVSTVVHKC